MLTLQWARIDLAEGLIRLDAEHSKNGEPRKAYLSTETTKKLAEYRASVAAALGAIGTMVFVLTENGPLKGKPIGEFRKQWHTATGKAGFPGLILHDLRRSAVRAMVRSGTPESVCMKISGHTTNQIFKRTTSLRDARDRRAQFGHNQASKVVALPR